LCPKFAGASYKKMEEMGGIQWTCPTEDHPGTPYLYTGNKFDTPSGKGLLFTTEWRSPKEAPDAEYPLVLCTVRQIEHYSVRTMTGNCAALQQAADEPGHAQISVEDAERLGIEDQELIWVASRQGKVMTRAMVTDRVIKGAIYMTYHWWIGACNEIRKLVLFLW
jgi:formate dehydrogenase major subunit